MSKLLTLVSIFGALAALVIVSYVASHDRAQRIACLHNQHMMSDALFSFEADNAGNVPRKVGALKPYFRDPERDFARCPADPNDTYSYNPSSGDVICPNPEHRHRL